MIRGKSPKVEPKKGKCKGNADWCWNHASVYLYLCVLKNLVKWDWCSTVALFLSILVNIFIVVQTCWSKPFWQPIYRSHMGSFGSFSIKFLASKLFNKRVLFNTVCVEKVQITWNSWQHGSNFGTWTNPTLALSGRSPITLTPVTLDAPILGLSLVWLLWHNQCPCTNPLWFQCQLDPCVSVSKNAGFQVNLSTWISQQMTIAITTNGTEKTLKSFSSD